MAKWILGISLPVLVAGMLFLYIRMDGLNQKIDRNHHELNQKIDRNHHELNQKIDGLKDILIQEIRK